MAIDFSGPAKRLEDMDLPRIGAEIGIGEDEIHAVIDVETAGGGFDSQGRPKMLFEPHIFYRHLNGAALDRAVGAGLAYPRWKRDYPKDSYPRLLSAMEIDETAALKSASWGLGQILGQNYALAGYGSPQAMVEDFVKGEAEQLQGMINFIRHTGLDDELRRHDWAGFARGYNGASYAENKYDQKLAAAFAKWSRIKDTPYRPSDHPAQEESKAITRAPVTAKASGAAAGGVAAAGAAHEAGMTWWQVALIAVVIAIVVYFAIHTISKKD